MIKTESPPNDQTLPQSPRRWFRFSLRTMMIIISIVAILLGLWIIPSERQIYALRQARAAGGDVLNVGEVRPATDDRFWHYFHPIEAVEILSKTAPKVDWDMLPRLNYLYLRNVSKDSVWIDTVLSDLRLSKNIKKFVIEAPDGDVDNLTMKSLIRYKELEALDIRVASCSDDGLQHLRNLTKLKTLNIVRQKILTLPLDLRFINDTKELSEFRLHTSGGLSFEDVDPTTLRRLESLDLGMSKVSNESLFKMSKLPALKSLALKIDVRKGFENVSDQAFEAIVSIPQLERLHFTGFIKLSKSQLEALAKSRSIKELLFNCAGDNPHLEILSQMKSLEKLSFGSRHSPGIITDRNVDFLTKFQKIKELDLRGSAITNAGLEKLTVLQNLEDLNLSQTKVTLDCLVSLRKIKNLKRLDIHLSSAWGDKKIRTQFIQELPGVQFYESGDGRNYED